MNWLKSCAAAFRFLTVLPMPGSLGAAAEDLEGAPPFFPLVGGVLGLAAAGAALLFWSVLPPLAAASALTVFLLSLSGALHLDGLADTADGFFSSRTREKILEIMRDSRTGVMGAAAVVSVLLLKAAALSGQDGTGAAETAFLMVLGGRVAMVAMMAMLPYVRPGGGLGLRFYARHKWGPALVAIFVYALFWAALDGWEGLIRAAMVLVVMLIFAFYCYRKIGGATGDTLGAGCEIAETLTALICAAGLG
jgi:adenosylcobinamide-GDP ribazoletransferase